jgi:solute carrier family 25 (mitochondrial uncoupling protein), member 8/9
MNTRKMAGESDSAFFIRNVLMASAAGMTGEALTIPIDTAKVRL